MKTEFITAAAIAVVLGSAQFSLACADHSCSNDPASGGPESASCSSIQGNLQLNANSTTIIEIGGYTPCTEFDRITVGGLFTFNGTLRVERLNNFLPEPGDRFKIFQYGSRMGDFSNMINNFGVPGLTMSRSFTSTYMDLVMAAYLNGDTDLDGDVDFTDLLRVAQNYAIVANPTWFDGDFNNDAAVNFSDLLVVAQNYGQHVLSDSTIMVDQDIASSFSSDWSLVQSSVANPLPVAVPEPTSVALLAPVGLMLRRRR